MTLRESILEALKEGPRRAAELRHVTGARHEALYTELVALEARQQVRVEHIFGGEPAEREWGLA